MRRTDMTVDAMAREGFSLVRMGAFGRLAFEYDSTARKYAYFACPSVTSTPFGKRIRALCDEFRRVYDTTESVSTGTKLHILRFEIQSKKDKTFLDNIARSHGLAEFTHEGYVEAVRRERDSLLVKSYTALAVIFGVFALFFALTSLLVVWWAAVPGAIALFPAILNIVRAAGYTRNGR